MESFAHGSQAPGDHGDKLPSMHVLTQQLLNDGTLNESLEVHPGSPLCRENFKSQSGDQDSKSPCPPGSEGADPGQKGGTRESRRDSNGVGSKACGQSCSEWDTENTAMLESSPGRASTLDPCQERINTSDSSETDYDWEDRLESSSETDSDSEDYGDGNHLSGQSERREDFNKTGQEFRKGVDGPKNRYPVSKRKRTPKVKGKTLKETAVHPAQRARLRPRKWQEESDLEGRADIPFDEAS